MVDAAQVIEWFNETEDELYDMELSYLGTNDVIEMEGVPAEYTLKVIENQTDPEYNSYGYRSVDGYLIFEVTGPDGVSGPFKLPIGYESFEGWSYGVSDIKAVEKQEKVVKTWTWI